MEVLYPTVAAYAFLGVAILLAWRVLKTVWLRPRQLERHLREQGLDGNSYRPLSGDLKDMAMTIKQAMSRPISLSDDIVPRIVPFFLKTLEKHGKNSFIWLGPRAAVTIMDPELMKSVLTRNRDFYKHGTSPLAKLLVASFGEDQWAKHRKIINPAFHLDKLKHMVPAFYLSCAEMLSKWEEIASTSESCELDVWPDLQALTGDAISRAAFGSNYEEGRKIFELQREQTEHVLCVARSLYIPGSRFLPTKRNRRMKKIAGEVQASIRSIIDKRVKAMEAGEATSDDLLGMLLESNFNEIQEGGNKQLGLTTQEVIEDCKLFYFAGQETTSVLLLWTMVLLSKHQDWQDRAREEIVQQFGYEKPGFDEVNHLKIVTMILHEVLRLYPPIAVIYRKTPEETKLGEMNLPGGITLHLPTILLHHDAEIWGADAKEFNPERFSGGVAKAMKGQFTYFPFGHGPRFCIGQNFAMLEAKLAVALILQRFSLEISPSYAHAPFSRITIQPQFGAPLILRKIVS